MMRIITKFGILISAAILMLVADMTDQPRWLPFDIQVMSEAHAVAGRQRRTRRRGAAVGYQAGKQSAAASQQQQQQQQPQQQQEQQQQEAATPAAAPPPAAQPLPLGTVVNTLPEGCTKQAVGGVEYHYDGANYYRAAFQGNELIYVTAQP
jgi:hypothetical protein